MRRARGAPRDDRTYAGTFPQYLLLLELVPLVSDFDDSRCKKLSWQTCAVYRAPACVDSFQVHESFLTRPTYDGRTYAVEHDYRLQLWIKSYVTNISTRQPLTPLRATYHLRSVPLGIPWLHHFQQPQQCCGAYVSVLKISLKSAAST